MIRTQVYIPEQLYHLAKLYAEQEGVSISEYLRRGLETEVKNKDRAVRRRGKGRKRSFSDLCGKFRLPGGVTNIAAAHNDIYDL